MSVDVLGRYGEFKVNEKEHYKICEQKVILEQANQIVLYNKNINRLIKISGPSDLVSWRQLQNLNGSTIPYNEKFRMFIDGGCLVPSQKKDESLFSPSTPTLCLHIAHSCNMVCTYCYADGGDYGDQKRSFLSYETAIKAIQWFEDSIQEDNYHIILFGGEPLLQEKLIRRVIHFCNLRNQKKISFSLNTNGTLLTSDFVEFAVQNGLTISLSLDGTEEIHDKNRFLKNGLPSYNSIKNRLDLIPARLKRHLNSKVTITRDNPDLVQTLKHVEALGVGEVDFTFVNSMSQRFLENEDILKKWIPQLKELSGIALEAWLQDQSFIMNPFMKVYSGLISGRIPSWTCNAGRELIAVGTSGNFYPCFRYMNIEDHYMGSVTNGLNEHTVEKFEFHKEQIKNKKCFSCWASMICGGLCPLDSEMPTVKSGSRCNLTMALIEGCLEHLANNWVNNPELLKSRLLFERTKRVFKTLTL